MLGCCRKASLMRLIQRTLDRVVERKDVYPLSVLDIVAGMNIGKISEFDSQVVSSNCDTKSRK